MNFFTDIQQRFKPPPYSPMHWPKPLPSNFGEPPMFSTPVGNPAHRRATGREKGSLPCRFLELKKLSWFLKERPWCIHPWVKFSIQNIVLRVSRRKNSKLFPCGPLFLVFLTKSLLKYPSSTKLFLLPSLALKDLWLHTCTQVLFFLQNLSS